MPSEPLDPLGESADPRRYVPVASDEDALGALEAGIRVGRSPLLLEGPSGMGKTMILRVLAERARRQGQRVVLSPFLHVATEDVAQWLLHLLGESPSPAESPEAAFVAFVRARHRLAFVVLVDEIQSAPPATVRYLVELARAAGANLALVAGGTRGPALDAVRRSLAPAAIVSLPAALPRAEMEEICDGVLRGPGLDPVLRDSLRSARDAAVDASGGIPASLKAELVRRAVRFALDLDSSSAGRSEPSSAAGRSDPSSAGRSEPGATASKPGATGSRPTSNELTLDLPEPQPAGNDGEAVELDVRRLHDDDLELEVDLEVALAGAQHQEELEFDAADLGLEAADLERDEWPLPRDAREDPPQSPLRAGTRAGRARSAADVRTRARIAAAISRARTRTESAAAAALVRGGVALVRVAAFARGAGAGAGTRARKLSARGSSIALRATQRAGSWSRGATARAGTRARGITTGVDARSRGAAAWTGARARGALTRSRSGARAIDARARSWSRVGVANARAAAARTAERSRQLAATLASVARDLRRTSAPAELRICAGLLAVMLLSVALASSDSVSDIVRRAAGTGANAEAASAPPAEALQIHVNARPWARVRVDGVDVGPTPLGHLRVAPGFHDFEATFADGRVVRHRIEVGPERRFVMLR